MGWRGRVGGSFFFQVMDKFRTLDYVADFMLVDSRDYGVPHRRQRVWMWAQHRGPASWTASVKETFCRLQQRVAAGALPEWLGHSAAVGGDRFRRLHLLPREQLVLAEAQSRHQCRQPLPQESGRSRSSTCRARPGTTATADGSREHRLLEPEARLHVSVFDKSRRARPSTWRARPSTTATAEWPAEGYFVVDVAKSVQRAPWCEGAVPCLVPNSKPFWMHGPGCDGAVLSGLDFCVLQGIFPANFPLLSTWAACKAGDKTLRDLAGNAFTGTVLMAAVIAVLSASHGLQGQAPAQQTTLETLGSLAPVIVSDSDSD